MHKLNQLHWPLITGLGALVLLQPVMDITGFTEGLGRSVGPLLTTLLISLVWLLSVVVARVREPLLTLVFAGVVYGVFAIAIGVMLSSLRPDQITGPVIDPIASVVVLITDAVWGALVGLCALALERCFIQSRSGQKGKD